MVWHCVVLPGTQIVTVPYRVLTLGFVVLMGPVSTTTARTFAAVVVPPDEEPDDEPEDARPESPPPQDATTMHSSSIIAPPNARLILPISAAHPRTRRPGRLAASTRA